MLSPPPIGAKSPPSPRQPVFYAIVQHDFEAERADELDAKAGDPITVVAQSNYEWFVAKPISRLGRPGLIPVSFVTLHDPATGRNMSLEDVEGLMRRGDIPSVEEWKKAILQYKAASISLGVIDDDNSRGPVMNSPFMASSPPFSPGQVTPTSSMTKFDDRQESRSPSPIACLPPGILLSAEVASWHYEMNEYWFRINALFQPDNVSSSSTPPAAKQLVLFRVYNDFYDFQVTLLDLFPVEAGRAPGPPETTPRESKRILPYMPGPTQKVDDKVTNTRREELDAYVMQLCALWEKNADHILRHELIRGFFAPKAGDMEDEVEPAMDILEERYGSRYPDGQRSREDYRAEDVNGRHSRAEDAERIRHPFARMGVNEEEGHSDGSQYDDSADLRSLGQSSRTNGDRGPRNSGHSSRQDDYRYARPESSSSMLRNEHGPSPSPHPYPRSQSPLTSSRTQSPISERVTSPVSRTHVAPALSRLNTEQSVYYTTPNSPTTAAASAAPTLPTPISMTRARSGSSATNNNAHNNTNTPPISATNPNTAFVKIKIFDRLTQDLIAIRVSPRVTHEQLMEKVRARLGDDVQQLAYRDSVHNAFTGLHDDHELKRWLEGTDKHVLYAD